MQFVLKVHSPIFLKFGFRFHLKNHHSEDANLKFRLMYEANLYNVVAYIWLCKLSYGYHNQAHFH